MEETTNQEVALNAEQTVQEAKPVESAIERNIVAMRKKLEAEEAARKEAERRAEEAERRAQGSRTEIQQSAAISMEESDDTGLDPEDYAQNKYIQKNTKRINSKLSAAEQKMAALEQKLAYFEAKSETDAIKDFNDIVTDDNIKTFARLYPEDHELVMSNPNLRAKAKTMYNMIKNYGIANPVLSAVDEKLAANKAKPKSASSQSPQAPQTPLTRLGDYERRVLSDSDRDRIMQEVERKKSIG